MEYALPVWYTPIRSMNTQEEGLAQLDTQINSDVSNTWDVNLSLAPSNAQPQTSWNSMHIYHLYKYVSKTAAIVRFLGWHPYQKLIRSSKSSKEGHDANPVLTHLPSTSSSDISR